MVRRRKLEEEIARTKDPVVRKQLQELLDVRNRRSRQRIDKGIDKAKKIVNDISTFGAVDESKLTPEEKKEYDKSINFVMILFFGMIIAMALAGVILIIWAIFWG